MSERFTSEHTAVAELAAAQSLEQTPGQILQRARRALGVTISDVAHEVNLPEAKLAALEADDYQALSAPTFVKGYLRSCCRYYKLDGAEVLAAYQQHAQQLSDQGLPAEPPVTRTEPLETPFPEWSWAVLAGGAVVVAMAIFFIWRGAEPDTEAELQAMVQTEESGAADMEETVAAPVQPRQDTASNLQAVRGDAVSAEPAQTRTNEPVTPVPEANDQAEARAAASQRAQLASEQMAADNQRLATPVVSETAVVESPSQLPSPVVGGNQPQDELAFYFTGDCWIEVFDGAGQRLHQSLSRSGDRLTVVGNAPFSIMLGNARVASLQLNGVAVAIVPRADRNTLRMTVGDEL